MSIRNYIIEKYIESIPNCSLLEKEKKQYGILDPYRYDRVWQKILSGIVGVSIPLLSAAAYLAKLKDLVGLMQRVHNINTAREYFSDWGKKYTDDFWKARDEHSRKAREEYSRKAREEYMRNQARSSKYSNMDSATRKRHERLDSLLADWATRKTSGRTENELNIIKNIINKMASSLGRPSDIQEQEILRSLGLYIYLNEDVILNLIHASLLRAAHSTEHNPSIYPVTPDTQKRGLFGSLILTALSPILSYFVTKKYSKAGSFWKGGFFLISALISFALGYQLGFIFDYLLKIFNREERLKVIIHKLKDTKNKTDSIQLSKDFLTEYDKIPGESKTRYSYKLKKVIDFLKHSNPQLIKNLPPSFKKYV